MEQIYQAPSLILKALALPRVITMHVSAAHLLCRSHRDEEYQRLRKGPANRAEWIESPSFTNRSPHGGLA